jgi:tetratricopeptide (TPR) repeat protein
MKTERRHELKTNSLAHWLEEIPDLLRRHGNKILLAITLICLTIVLVRYHAQEAEDARVTASNNLNAAEAAISDLTVSSMRVLGDQQLMAEARNNDVQEAENGLDVALRTAQDPQIQAEVYLARGNLNWTLANYPVLPAAATQPALALKKSTDEYLTAAKNAYSEVLIDPLSENHHALTGARLGLAAIAENQGDWDGANHYYQQVSDDSATDPTFKDYAQIRAKMLDNLKHPVLLANGAEELRQPGPTLGPVAPPSVLNDLSPFSITPSQSIAPATPTTQPAGK